MPRKTTSNTGRFPMAYKLTLLMVSVLLVATVFQGWLIADHQVKILEREITAFGHSSARQIVRQIKEPLLAHDDLALQHIVGAAIEDNGVAGVEILNNRGERLTQSGVIPREASTMLEGQSHQWTGNDGHHYISFVESAYSNKLLVGEVLVSIHADVLRQVKEESRNAIFYTTLVLTLFGILISAWLSRIVTRPIIRLIGISKRIAHGDYNARFTEKRNDELGLLVDSLNRMTSELLHKVHVEQSFSRYVSPKVAKEVLANLGPQELGGKEVHASVLFADIVGFTALSEKMKAPEVSRLLNDYFSLVDQAVHQCNGHVDKYMGDCVMALFGVPEEDPTHMVQAIYCALLIQSVIECLNHRRMANGEITVRFRIGINGGLMLAGNMGSRDRMEYTVIGDAVNLASRLASASQQDEIIISEEVALSDEVATRFICEQRETLSLKGKEQPVTLYHVEDANEELQQQLEQDALTVFSQLEQETL